MSLDILTPRGQIAAEDQKRATQIVFGHSSEHGFIHTKTDEAGAVDGFTTRSGFVTGVAEIKSRDMSIEQLMGEFNGEWLLTFQKLKDMAILSRLIVVPGYGFLYLKFSNCVLVQKLTDKEGNIVCKHRVDRTQSQATCNGGTAWRENAFIDMRNARTYNET